MKLSVEQVPPSEVQTWLRQVQEMHRQIVEKQGYFPDTTPDIAEDRAR